MNKRAAQARQCFATCILSCQTVGVVNVTLLGEII